MNIIPIFLLLLSNIFGISNDHKEQRTYNYINTKLGFQLELPIYWQDKVYIHETGSSVSIIYKSVNGNEDAELFNVFLISPIQYKVHEKHVGFFTYLGERNGLVIAKFSPTGAPYDNLNTSQKQDYDLYFDLFKDIKLILNSFKLTEENDVNIYKQVIEESKGKDDEFKEEYERLIKEETNKPHETKH